MTTEDIRRFGVSTQEATRAFARVASLPLPDHVEAMLARAVHAIRPGWWLTPMGWIDRWKWEQWRRGQRRGVQD